MRIAVFSDTHGAVGAARLALQKLGPVDWVLHAGDYYEDARKIASIPGTGPLKVKAVLGNCDYKVKGPREEVFGLSGVRILLTHGHTYDVKRGLDRLFYRAKEMGARVVIFGHSHVPTMFTEDDILFLNPGSLALPRGDSQPSYGLLTVKQGEAEGKILELKDGTV